MKTNKEKQKYGAGFIRIGKVLPSVSKQYKLDQALVRYEVIRSWQEVIAGFFENALNQTKAIDFKNGKLTIACLSEALGYEIRALSSRIIYAINSLLGKNLVYAIWIES